MILGGRIEVLGQKPVPLPFCPSQILLGLVWNRTRASALRANRSNPS